MRVTTALLICLGMTICSLSSLAQTSTSVPSTPASRAERAIETPRAPVFEYLGRLHAETGTPPLSKTARRGRAQSCRSSAAASKARASRRRCRRRPGTGSPTGPTAATGSMFASHSKQDDQALILVTYNGNGQTTDAAHHCVLHTLFETGDSRYAWLTRLQAVAVGERVGTALSYDFFALK